MASATAMQRRHWRTRHLSRRHHHPHLRLLFTHRPNNDILGNALGVLLVEDERVGLVHDTGTTRKLDRLVKGRHHFLRRDALLVGRLGLAREQGRELAVKVDQRLGCLLALEVVWR